MATRDWTAADLRRFRATQRMNQTEAAKLFGIAQTTYSLWERGKLPQGFPDKFEAALVKWFEATKGASSGNAS